MIQQFRLGVVGAILALGLAGCSEQSIVEAPEASDSDSTEATTEAGPSALDFTMETIDGQEQDLEDYRGKVVMIVNTASKCGLTGQYADLEALYREKKDDGFIILGFPANNFMGQEPGTNEEIAEFCSSNYDVTFPMFAKISVKGEDQHPLYGYLTSLPEPLGGDPGWNFTKFIIDRDGNVAARVGSRTNPKDPEVVAKIDELLAAG